MDVLKITLNEEGRVSYFAPDFKVMRGAYGNILINVEVPKSLLVDAVYENNVNIAGNNIRIAAIIRTATGRNLKTKKFELSYVKDFTRDGVEYRLYQRKCPKVFTMWETVSLIETATNGLLELVINVVNWSLDENGARIEESWPSQIVPVDVYAGEYLDEGEELENPSDFELLQSQVQEGSARQKETDASLFGTDADTLGTYLLERLIAGNKITIQKDTTNAPNNQIKISVETIKANEVSIETPKELHSNNVQGIIDELVERTKSVENANGDQDGVNIKENYQKKVDNMLICENKSVVGAINKIYSEYVTTNTEQIINASKTIVGNLTIEGNITQNGEQYITQAEKVETEDDYILMRKGATGGLGSGYSGFEVENYNGAGDNARLVVDGEGTARVGDVGDEQPLLTRQETSELTDGEVLIWNATTNRAEGSKDFAKTNDVDTKLANKRNITKNANKLYATDENGNQTEVAYGRTTDAYGIVQRGAGGQIAVAEAKNNDHATNLGQVNSLIEAKYQELYDLLPTVEILD